MGDFVSGDSKRVFINTALGCQSSCSFCYLGVEGIPIGARPNDTLSAEEVISIVNASGYFREGVGGSLVSIGCFSECWDDINRGKTKALISYFLEKGNQVQMATKRCIDREDIEEINGKITRDGQFGLFVSSSTVSEWQKFERGTTSPAKRFDGLSNAGGTSVKAFLYIKPVINGVTIKDLNVYKDLIKRVSCDVVVGGRFLETGAGVPAPIISQCDLRVVNDDDEGVIINELSDFGRVYRTSFEAMRAIGDGF